MTSTLDRLSGILTPPTPGASDETIQDWSRQAPLFHLLDDEFEGPWVTESAKIWGGALVNLAKVVVEGFEKKYFEDGAKSLGASPQPYGSLR